MRPPHPWPPTARRCQVLVRLPRQRPPLYITLQPPVLRPYIAINRARARLSRLAHAALQAVRSARTCPLAPRTPKVPPPLDHRPQRTLHRVHPAYLRSPGQSGSRLWEQVVEMAPTCSRLSRPPRPKAFSPSAHQEGLLHGVNLKGLHLLSAAVRIRQRAARHRPHPQPRCKQRTRANPAPHSHPCTRRLLRTLS